MTQLLQQASNDRYGLYINGEYVDSSEQKFIPSLNPTNDEPWYEISDASAADVDAAVSAARAVLVNPAWSRLSQTGRGNLLRQLGDLIAEHGERLAQIETRDNGKLIKEMRAQMASLPDTYYYYAGMADKITGETIPINKADTFNYTLREPIGVVWVLSCRGIHRCTCFPMPWRLVWPSAIAWWSSPRKILPLRPSSLQNWWAKRDFLPGCSTWSAASVKLREMP